MSTIVYEEVLPPGAMWSMRIRRFARLRLTALDAGANVSALFYNAEMPLDRLNIPDTLKALHTARLHRGHVLMSDMGRALVSITEDSLGWHDPLGGIIDAGSVREKFGGRTFQQVRNAFHRNALDNFLIELGKYGMGEKDIVANVNFFSKVTVDDTGRMHWTADWCKANSTVELRAEMDVLAILANCPHPMHPGGEYPQARIQLALGPGSPTPADDFCRNYRPECGRALQLTERYYL